MTIKNLGKGAYKYFPYATIRKDQDRLVEDLDEFINERVKIALIKGDTGLGKEVAVSSQIAKHRNEFDRIIYTIPTDMGKVNIEKEIALIKEKFQDISLRVVTLHNKENLCELYKKIKKSKRFKEKEIDVYELCDGSSKQHRDSCPYYQNLEKVKKAKMIICDYNYIFDPHIRKAVFGDMFDKENVLLIINEVHELPERITNQFSFHVGNGIFKHVIKEITGENLSKTDREEFLRKFGKQKDILKIVVRLEEEFRTFLSKNYDRFYATTDNKIEADLQKLFSRIDGYQKLLRIGDEIVKWKIGNDVGAISHTKVLAKFLRKVNFIKGLDYYFSYVEKIDENNYKLGVACLNPYPLIRDPFTKAAKIIMYSGTLYPERYLRLFMLGKFGEVFVPNPYKAEYIKNRVDIFYSDGRLTKDLRDSKKLQKSANELSSILKELPKPCAIFVVRPLWTKVKELMSFRGYRIMEEDPNTEDKKQFFNQLKKADVVVLSPYGSYKQSLDMSFLKSVIILGIPDPMLDLVTKKTLDYYKEKFLKSHGLKADWVAYELICRLPAIEKTLQATGRGIRKEEDHLLAVWFDERWITQSRFIAGVNKKNCISLPSIIKEVNAYKRAIC